MDATRDAKIYARFRHLFFGSIVILAAFSAVFFIMPIATEKNYDGDGSLLVLNGIWFWATGIILVIMQISENKLRKKLDHEASGKPGIICFFSNRAASAADILLGVSILAMYLSNASFISIAATVFFFGLHCMLNGKNYRVYSNLPSKTNNKER